MATGDVVQFEAVFKGEIDSVNLRRKKLGRPEIKLEDEVFGATPLTMSDGTTPLRPTEKSEVVGLALSGGGIRSAAFCLGALQALHDADVLDKIDYLSTVSGGGYIGASLSSGMTADGGHFPFESYLSEDETPSLQHVRDHSNFLFPNGATDLLRNASIYVRGLIANSILVLPVLLLAAAFTIFFALPVQGPYDGPNFFGLKLPPLLATTIFGLTLLGLILIWGIMRSYSSTVSEVTDRKALYVGALVWAVALAAFCELQPFILEALLHQKEAPFVSALVDWIRGIALVLAPIAAAIAFVANKVGEVIKSALESERLRDQIGGYVAKAAIYVAAAIVPVLLWVLYLEFSYWGVCLTKQCDTYNAPGWLYTAAYYFPGLATRQFWGDGTHVIAQFYIAISALCLFVAQHLRPNANSLHPLYRDRLSEAFLFRPEKVVPRDPLLHAQPPLAPLHLKLTELSETNAPYHLINTALNVQSSKQVNRRGRNADFFLFSRNYSGSRATDYVATEDLEHVMVGFDLGTVMATSGAAASSSMGAATIKPLTPTLALLNIRLGYWLRNPRHVKDNGTRNFSENLYFLLELLGMLDETRRSVYLTDGGHIENLGIYELLRRRCKVIIAVDAEADPQVAFGSFNVLERYALIDLGVRIDLPWQQITDVSKATGKAIDTEGNCEKKLGPHVAIGEIRYPGDRKGILIYIKSSMTGDENDYVFHYKKRYGAFPHETTLDQLFSEEQFEAYRALGYHATHRFFGRRDRFAHLDSKDNLSVKGDIAFLDALFQPLAPDLSWPQQHTTFADWLIADEKAEAEQAAAKSAEKSLLADVAAPQQKSRRPRRRLRRE